MKLALAVLTLAASKPGLPHAMPRLPVIRVGVDHTPPFYYVEKGAPVRGLAVDVLNEAARRAGMTLIWIPVLNMPLNQALSKGLVDLWPVVAETPERRAKFFVGEQWLASDYIVLSLAGHPVSKPADAGDLPIAHTPLGITTQIAHAFFPGNRFLITSTRQEAVIDVCRNNAVAAVMETRVLDTMLLHRPNGCEDAAFRIVTIPGANRPLGLLATKAFEAEARILGREIEALEKNNFISSALDVWCPFTAESTRSVWDRKAAMRDSRISTAGAVLVSLLAIVLVCVLRRANRLRREAESVKTSQQTTLEQLRVSESRWQLALQGAGDGLWDWDLTTNRVFRSQISMEMVGYAATEVSQTPEAWLQLIHPDDLPALTKALEEHLSGKTQTFICEYRILHRDGNWRWFMDRGQAVFNGRQEPLRMAGSHTDITARKAAEARLNTEASTDALTGVANRREFDRKLEILIRQARGNNRPLTLCISDLDHFKRINDTHGHRVGDHVLFSFASAAQDTLRSADFIARTGGDEFVFLLPETTAQEALGLADRIRLKVESIQFEIPAGLPFRTSCSFGIASLSSQHKTGADLFESADQSLYEAKKKGRNCVLAA